MMPRASVRPKPLTVEEAKKNNERADMIDTMSASIEVVIACLTPLIEAAFILLPSFISSLNLSITRIDESAAMPIDKIMPAMPAKDRLNAPIAERLANTPK